MLQPLSASRVNSQANKGVVYTNNVVVNNSAYALRTDPENTTDQHLSILYIPSTSQSNIGLTSTTDSSIYNTHTDHNTQHVSTPGSGKKRRVCITFSSYSQHMLIII